MRAWLANVRRTQNTQKTERKSGLAKTGPAGPAPTPMHHPVSARLCVVLLIDDKVDIIGMIDRGSSLTAITEKFGIGKSTMSDIKKSKGKILAFSYPNISAIRTPLSPKGSDRRGCNVCYHKLLS